jgi:hypothetical protein
MEVAAANRWPPWIKAEGRIMKDEVKIMLAPASGR